MDFNASLQAADQEPYPGPTQSDRDNAPLSPSETFENFNPTQPFFEDDYPSQRFRPQEHLGKTASEGLDEEQQSDAYGPYYSPPETFMPSESPEALSVELHNSNIGPSVDRLVSSIVKLLSHCTDFHQRSSTSDHQTDLLKAAVPKWNSKLQRH